MSCASSSASRRAGSRIWIASALRFFQWSSMRQYRLWAQLTPPSRKPKRSVGNRLRDAAEEQRLRDRLVALREPADLVVLVARDRRVRPPADRARVERRRDAELDALRPHRVVVVRAVDAEAVLVEDEVREVGVLACEVGHRAQHVAREHERLEPERGRELELLDRFVGRVHRDHAGRDHAITEPGEHLGVVEVVRARRRAPQLVVAHARQRDHLQAGARVDDREVEADLVESLVEQARQHGGAAVERVLGRYRPPHRYRRAVVDRAPRASCGTCAGRGSRARSTARACPVRRPRAGTRRAPG